MVIIKKICILGGTGFVGRHIIAQLANQDIKIRLLTRDRERHRDVFVFPNVELVEADPHDLQVLKKAFADVDAVINLVGILNDEYKKYRTYQSAHIDLSRKVIDTCRKLGVKRLLHMSALNADASRGRSQYLRTKGEAENVVHTVKDVLVTSFQPSVIFGPDDQFFNRFAALLKVTPPFMPFALACPNAKLSPVFVEDVAAAFVNALNNKQTFGKRYQLCGPKSYTLKELVQYTAKLSGIRRVILPMGNALSKMQAIVLGFLPGKPFTLDNYFSLQSDSVCKNSFPEELGITPRSVESVVPGYLSQRSNRGRFDQYRAAARR